MRQRSAHDPTNNRTTEDGETVAAVMDVNDRRRGRRRRWRRRGRNPAAVVVMHWGAMVDGGGFRAASAMRGGHCRAAEGYTRESRDCHCLDRLVHVTPTFPGFLPLHKARREKWSFLTEIFIEKILSEIQQTTSFLCAGVLFAPG